jgi:DNA-binding MarR family transcriptional regulator
VARRLKADPPTMSGVVDGLVNGGYVERREDPEDRRKLRLFLTERAREIEQKLEHAEEQGEAAMLAFLTASESESLKQLLRRLCEAAEGPAE